MDEELQKHIYADTQRLDRIESKIDKLSDTVVAIARAEEKLVGLTATAQEVNKRLDEHDDRLDKHAARLNDGAVTLNTISKLFWITIAAAIAVAIDLYWRTPGA